MAYDDVILMLGNFGRYQRRIYLLLCLPAILCAFHDFSNTFLQAKPNHRCQLRGEFSNSTYDLSFEDLNASFPYDSVTGKYSSCSVLFNGSEIPCNKYIYDYTKYKSSTVIEWNIVCNRAYLNALGDSMFMFGSLLGSIIFGVLSDKLGRRIVFFAALVLQVIFGLLMGVASNFWMYIIFRLFVGSTFLGVYSVAYVIALEMVGPKDRLKTSVMYTMFFSLGYILVALFSYFIREWRYLQISLTLPGVLFFSYWWFVPESIRWLLMKGRIEEAKKIVSAAAKENKVHIPDDRLHSLLSSDLKNPNDKENSVTVLDIFKYPKLLKISLIVFFDWMIISMTYYGLSWSTSSLGGNDYINFVICGAVEFPANIFLLLTVNRWGGKCILCGSMVIGGVALMLTLVVPNDVYWATVTLSMVGKLAITCSFGLIYIFSLEIFPTAVRNSGLGLSSVCARIGSISMPLINLTGNAWKPFPFIIFGTLVLIGSCVSLILPERSNQILPATMSDVNYTQSSVYDLDEKELEKLNANDEHEN